MRKRMRKTKRDLNYCIYPKYELNIKTNNEKRGNDENCKPKKPMYEKKCASRAIQVTGLTRVYISNQLGNKLNRVIKRDTEFVERPKIQI